MPEPVIRRSDCDPPRQVVTKAAHQTYQPFLRACPGRDHGSRDQQDRWRARSGHGLRCTATQVFFGYVLV